MLKKTPKPKLIDVKRGTFRLLDSIAMAYLSRHDRNSKAIHEANGVTS